MIIYRDIKIKRINAGEYFYSVNGLGFRTFLNARIFIDTMYSLNDNVKSFILTGKEW